MVCPKFPRDVPCNLENSLQNTIYTNPYGAAKRGNVSYLYKLNGRLTAPRVKSNKMPVK